jgi:hypothetical protein
MRNFLRNLYETFACIGIVFAAAVFVCNAPTPAALWEWVIRTIAVPFVLASSDPLTACVLVIGLISAPVLLWAHIE